MKLKSIVSLLSSLLLLISNSSIGHAQTCEPVNNCTHTVSGSYLTVNNGQVYCLSSGTWSGGVTLNAGGTIYIAPGASLTVSYNNGDFNGTIINCGTLNLSLWNNPRELTLVNYGTVTSNGIQNFRGTINNYGTITLPQFTAYNATINNYKKMNFTNTEIYNTLLVNYDTIIGQGKFYALNGGFLENKPNAFISLNMNTWGNAEFANTIDNLGTMLVNNPSSGSGISYKVNNYGILKLYGALTISNSAYFTNDSILEFVNIPTVNLQGALLQNNNILRVRNGGIAMNNANSEIVNNGLMVVDKTLAQNAGGSKITNNCKIVTDSMFIGTGKTINRGLIWTLKGIAIENQSSEFFNDTTGFVRGKNFRNSGKVTGYGTFYFSHHTDFVSAGTFAGSSSSHPIVFFDATPNGNNIFDAFVANNPAINTIRPTSLTPMDTTDYVCTALYNRDVAGFPPASYSIYKACCSLDPLSINLSDYVEPHVVVPATRTFSIVMSSARLFEYANSANPTNNSTYLVIPGKGTFDLDETNGVITFTPEPTFNEGSVRIQYIISNATPGDPMLYPSSRTDITIEMVDGLPRPGINPVPVQ